MTQDQIDAVLEELGDALDDADEQLDPDGNQNHQPALGKIPLSEANRNLFRDARARVAAQIEAEREHRRPIWRAEGRANYRKQKAAEGQSVRSYHHHDHQSPEHAEDAEERQRRMHRDRQRTRRGKTEETVRIYTDLSGYTQEEKVEHERALGRERKRRSRERQRCAPRPAGNPNERARSNLIELPEEADLSAVLINVPD